MRQPITLARTECQNQRVIVTERTWVDLRSVTGGGTAPMYYRTYEDLPWDVENHLRFYHTEDDALKGHHSLVNAIHGNWGPEHDPYLHTRSQKHR